MASLRDRIDQLFRRRPAIPDTAGELSTLEQRSAGGDGQAMELARKFQAELERVAVIKSCRQMYKTDPRVEKMLRTLARDTLKGGFAVKSEHAQAKEEADALQTRLGLNQKLERYVRLSGRDGDSFLQLGIDERLEIVSLTRKPTLQVRRDSNEADQFDDASRAFWMADELYWGMEPPREATWFALWEIIHARWQWDEESRYGTPMMAAATSAFKRVSEGEIDVAVRRKVRAGMRYHHVVEGNESDVKAYKELNKAALNNPTAAQLDFFTNKPGGITAIQGDAHMSEIEDVKHHIATMFTAGDVPMELIAYGEGLNRDILGEKKAEYEEILRQVREWTADEIVRPLLERQWLLKGILPESVSYSIEWRHATGLTAQDFLTIVDSVLRMKILGIADDVIQTILEKQLGVDVGKLMPQADGETERFANLLKGLSV